MLKAFAGGTFFGAAHGTAPPQVVALHGWGRSHRDFDAVLEGLDAVALDLPGFGATPPPPEAWTTVDYARAVAAVLEDAPAAVVVGHSFGGRVAVRLAAGWPERVRALVLTGVPLLRLPGATVRRPPLAFRVARRLHARGLLPAPRMERLRRRYGSSDYRAATGVMREVLVRAVNERYDDVLSALACPVELVWGSDDIEVPAAVAEAVTTLVADARLTVVPGAGHLVPTVAPASLRAAILRRLA